MKPESRPKKSPVKEAREAAYRTLILEAAERVFAEKGYDGAKIKDVADEAGLALGTVYTVYPSKREVFVAVHEHRGAELVATVVASMQGVDAPFDIIAAALRATCRFYSAHPHYLRMHLHSGTSWAAPRLDVPEEQDVYDRGLAPLAAIFAEAERRGQLVAEDAETCGRLLPAMLQVYLAEWVEARFRTPPDELAARIDRQIRRSFQRAPGA